MNLKKNDKIILIVGVVILIIAGAGIALYNTPSDSSDIEDDTNDEMKFEYSWEKNSRSMGLDNPQVEKDTPFEKEYSIESPEGTVLTDVKVNIQWEDDNTFGILRTKGQDVLTATVSCDGTSKDKESTLKGNDNFTYSINSVPSDATKYASDADEFQSMLDEEIMNMNDAVVNIELSIVPGEPRWRFLFNRDTGNKVDISVEYTYYYYDFSFNTIDDDDMKSSGSDDEVKVGSHQIGEYYVNLAYGRGMI